MTDQRVAARYAPAVSNDLADVERELCRIPEVRAARIVADGDGQPVEIHILAVPGKQAKQVVRDVQSVVTAIAGLSIDHRIVSVVQLEDAVAPVNTPSSAVPDAPDASGGPTSDEQAEAPSHADADQTTEVPGDPSTPGRGTDRVGPEEERAAGAGPSGVPAGAGEAVLVPRTSRLAPGSRVVVERVLTLRRGLTCTAEVVLRLGEEMITGNADGSSTDSAVLRLVAEATLDALGQLHPGVSRAFVETASLARVDDRAIALSSVVLILPHEELMTGSAPVRAAGEHEAIARSVLDALNRRLHEQLPPSR